MAMSGVWPRDLGSGHWSGPVASWRMARWRKTNRFFGVKPMLSLEKWSRNMGFCTSMLVYKRVMSTTVNGLANTAWKLQMHWSTGVSSSSFSRWKLHEIHWKPISCQTYATASLFFKWPQSWNNLSISTPRFEWWGQSISLFVSFECPLVIKHGNGKFPSFSHL